MKYKLLLIALLFSLIANAQDSLKISKTIQKNNIGINIAGEASRVAINYEHNIVLKNHHFVNLGIGIGRNEEFALWTSGKSYVTFPHHLTYNIGQKRHFFELGVGGTVLVARETNFNSYFIYPITGYRFQSIRQGRLFFRIYLSFLVHTGGEHPRNFPIPGGAAIGFTF